MDPFFPGGIGAPEMIIVGIIAVILFGKRLPEVGRSLGKSFMEFRRGLSGIEGEVRRTFDDVPRPSEFTGPAYDQIDDRDDASGPKFEPPPEEPST